MERVEAVAISFWFSKYKQLLVKLSLLPRTSTEITHLDLDSKKCN